MVESDQHARAKTILPLTWSVVETMDILADVELMKAIEGCDDDMRAGWVVPWKPRGA